MKNEIRPQPRKVHPGDSFRRLATVPLAFLPSPDLLEASLYQPSGPGLIAAPGRSFFRRIAAQSRFTCSILGTPTAHHRAPTAATAAVT